MKKIIWLSLLLAGFASGQTKVIMFNDATLEISGADTIIYPIGTFKYLATPAPDISLEAETYWKFVIACYWNTNYEIRVYNSFNDLVWEDVGRTTLTNMNHPEEVLAELQDDVNGKVMVSINGGMSWKCLYYMGVDKDKQPWAVIPTPKWSVNSPVMGLQNILNPPAKPFLYPEKVETP